MVNKEKKRWGDMYGDGCDVGGEKTWIVNAVKETAPSLPKIRRLPHTVCFPVVFRKAGRSGRCAFLPPLTLPTLWEGNNRRALWNYATFLRQQVHAR